MASDERSKAFRALVALVRNVQERFGRGGRRLEPLAVGTAMILEVTLFESTEELFVLKKVMCKNRDPSSEGSR